VLKISLTTSFGQGLSTAVGSALNGQKYAFDKFAAGFGQKMMDMAFTNLAKQFEPSINGLLGGIFGDAKGGISKLTGLGAGQASKALADAEKTVATMTVNATSVTINGNVASGLPGSATTGGASPLPTIQGAGGTALPAAEGGLDPVDFGQSLAAAAAGQGDGRQPRHRGGVLSGSGGGRRRFADGHPEASHGRGGSCRHGGRQERERVERRRAGPGRRDHG
jgi:hypothetical protein